MNTLLITDVLGNVSHAEESSESSNIIFLNSVMKLLNFITAVTSSCAYFIYLSSILKPFMKVFIKLHCLSFVDLFFVEELCLGAVGQPFCGVLPGNANIWVFPVGLTVVVCFCSLPVGSVRRTRI